MGIVHRAGGMPRVANDLGGASAAGVGNRGLDAGNLLLQPLDSARLDIVHLALPNEGLHKRLISAGKVQTLIIGKFV